ncbi:acid protease [Gyrodon lividus]|nr:acid protease [Gyrodon lividus]
MRLTLATIVATPLFFVAAMPQSTKQRGTAIPLSKLSSLVNADQSINLEASNYHISSTTIKILCGFDNFEKNTGASHPSAVKGARKRYSGRLPLPSLGDHLNHWFCTTSIDTPPRNFAVMFDTSLRHIFLIWCIDCDNSCNSHAIYNPGASLTSAELGKPFFAQFAGGGRVSGYQYTDNVTILGLTATHQTLGAAVHYSPDLAIRAFAGDGLLGMAFKSISYYHQSPLFRALVTEGQTDEPVFAFNFADPRPELYLGGTNPDMYTGNFTWTPVTQQGYWQVNIDSIMGNGQNMVSDVAGIIDMGTIFIHGFPREVAVLYAVIGGTPFDLSKGLYSFPCDAVPSVSFTFGGTPFPFPAESFSMGFDSDNPSQCIGAIAAGNVPFWIIGTHFLSNAYTAFDVSNKRVGFATLA